MERTEDQLKEIMDRCRRMETRLTKFLEMHGFDTKVQRPLWDNGVVDIPSLACSVRECLNVVPENWSPDSEIIITHRGVEVASLYLPPPPKEEGD